MNKSDEQAIRNILAKYLQGIELERAIMRIKAKTCQDTPIVKKIKTAVTAYFSLQEGALEAPSRDKQTAFARHIACYLCYTMTDSSYPAIGKMMGGRDHTTIMHAVAKVGGDDGMRLIADDIRDSLLGDGNVSPVSRQRKKEMVMMQGANYAC